MKERFQTFTVLISKISRNIRKIKNQEMAEYGLRSVHVTCLYYLYSSDALTATDLCERCEEDKATISRGLDFLEEKGFIVCKSSLAKRYKAKLILTEKGYEAAARVAERAKYAVEQAGSGLSDEQRAVFYYALGLIADNLQMICDEGLNND